MKNVEVGQKLIAFWGAMHPVEETVVEAIEDGIVWHRDASEEDSTLYMTDIKNIRPDYSQCNGVGVYINQYEVA